MAFVAVPPMLLPADVALIQVDLKQLNTNKVNLNDATEEEVYVIIQKLRSTGCFVDPTIIRALIFVLRA